MSKLQKSIDYFYSHPGCSKNAAAKQFAVAPPNLIVALQKHDRDVTVFEAVGTGKLNAIDAWLGGNPGATAADVSKQFGIPANTLRAAYRGQAISARRARLVSGYVEADPVAEMREKCARIAETVGGEHGAAIAAAIRSVEV